MEFCGGRMKTIISSTLGAFIGLFAATPAALALHTTPGVPPVFHADCAIRGGFSVGQAKRDVE